MAWKNPTFLSFDTETTGLNWNEDRIIQAGITPFFSGKARESETWLINTGRRSCSKAVEVHGITNEKQFLDGQDEYQVLSTLVIYFRLAAKNHHPIVVMNAPFDLNMMLVNCNRVGLTLRLEDNLFLDPLAIDRFYSKNRVPAFGSGLRTLTALAKRYEVADYPSHDAGMDSLKAGEVMMHMTQMLPQITRVSYIQMQEKQRRWHRDWCRKFKNYADYRGFDFTETEWPYDSKLLVNNMFQGVLGC